MSTESTPSPRETSPPRWLSPVLFVGLILMLALGLEVVAQYIVSSGRDPVLQRVVGDYDQLASEGADWIRFVPDPELSYRLRPDFTLTSPKTGGVTHHNHDGFRNDQDFTPKAENVLRIACYGASTTYGVSVDANKDTYPAQLESLLNGPQKPGGWERVEVFNLGVGGYTSREILGTLKRTLPILQPDVVLIQNAINDVIPRFYPDFQADYSHFRTDFAPLELRAWQRLAYRSRAWLVFSYGLGWIKPLSLQTQTQKTLPPVDEALANLEKNPTSAYEANLRAMVSTAQESGATVWLLTQAYLDAPAFALPNEESRRLEEKGFHKGLEEHTAVVMLVAATMGPGLIDMSSEMPNEFPLFADQIHMTAAGNKVKAAIVARALQPTLAKTTP